MTVRRECNLVFFFFLFSSLSLSVCLYDYLLLIQCDVLGRHATCLMRREQRARGHEEEEDEAGATVSNETKSGGTHGSILSPFGLYQVKSVNSRESPPEPRQFRTYGLFTGARTVSPTGRIISLGTWSDLGVRDAISEESERERERRVRRIS